MNESQSSSSEQNEVRQLGILVDKARQVVILDFGAPIRRAEMTQEQAEALVDMIEAGIAQLLNIAPTPLPPEDLK